MDENPSFDYEVGWERKGRKFLEFEAQIEHPIRKLIYEKTQEIGAESVLDVGCATCSDYPLYEGKIKYYGRDITRKFIKRAKQRFPDIDVDYGNILELPFPDNSVDVVYCKDVLEHLPPGSYVKAVSEMKRVAKKAVMIAFFRPPWDKPTQHNILKKIHWNNNYNTKDVLNTIGEYEVKITRDVGYNRSELWVITL